MAEYVIGALMVLLLLAQGLEIWLNGRENDDEDEDVNHDIPGW